MSKKSKIGKISDLPYYKDDHAPVLKDMKIKSLDDLLDALYDEERSEELIDQLKGVGPKIASRWIEIIEDQGVLEDDIVEAEPESSIEEVESEIIEEEPMIIEEEPESSIEEEEPKVVEEGGYFAAPKPELNEETRRLFEIRKSTKLPKFRRQEWFRYKRLGEKYRRPKGMHSKMRRRYKYRPPMASVGYRTPSKVRDLHSSGFKEVLVHNPDHLEGLDPKTQAARVGHSVGYKKRLEIERKATQLGIHILNRMRY
jgi:large subunit ribosomal protein L32e